MNDFKIKVMPKMRSNRIIANNVDYEVEKINYQYRLPVLEKYNVGDFVGNEMIIAKIKDKVRLKDITQPLGVSCWVAINEL